MYARLGRMVGRSYEDTVQLMVKMLKSAEVGDHRAPITVTVVL